ncbi:hypothetical protein Gasu2_01680 [Galdieria sulphuraria]|nr:hypothetical protein Gasu2_01680 [Galdieria sulphuraria]
MPDVGFYEDRQPTLSKSKEVPQFNDKTKTISKRRRRKASFEKKYLSKYIKALRTGKKDRPVELVSYPWEDGVVLSNRKRPIKGKEDELTKEMLEIPRARSANSKTVSGSTPKIAPPKMSDVYVRKGNGRFKLSKDKIRKERLRKFLLLRKKYERDVQKQISQSIDELEKEQFQLSVNHSSSVGDRKMGRKKLLETKLRKSISRFLDDQASSTFHKTENDVNSCGIQGNGNEQLIRTHYSRLLCKLLPKPYLK